MQIVAVRQIVAGRQIVAEADSYSKTGSCIQADSCRRAFICMQIIAERQIRLAGRQKGRKTNCETCRKAESRLVQIQFSALPSQLMPACLPYTLYSTRTVYKYILYTVLFIYGKSDARPQGGGCKIYCKTWSKLDRTLFKAAGTVQ